MTATFTITRSQLVDAIAGLRVTAPSSGPAKGLVLAESMADAIIGALAPEAAPVHYHWPAACGRDTAESLWSGDLDRVTCESCRHLAAGEGTEP